VELPHYVSGIEALAANEPHRRGPQNRGQIFAYQISRSVSPNPYRLRPKNSPGIEPQKAQAVGHEVRRERFPTSGWIRSVQIEP
jgi:hypothetical protein